MRESSHQCRTSRMKRIMLDLKAVEGGQSESRSGIIRFMVREVSGEQR